MPMSIQVLGVIGEIIANMYGNELNSCYNYANINANGKVNSNIDIAGIVARNSSSLYNLYNAGNVSVTGNINQVKIGGIGADASLLSNCINYGTIMPNNASINTLFIGGACGYSYNGTLNNIYNLGNIEEKENDVTTKYKGLLIGRILNTSLKDSFYKEQEGELAVGSNDNGVVENIKILDYAINALSIIGADFKEDTNNINNGYPVLIWQ